MRMRSGYEAGTIGARLGAAVAGLLLLTGAGPAPAQPRGQAPSSEVVSPRLVVQSGPRNPVGLAIALSPDKQLVATAGGERSAAYIWQAETGRLLCTLKADVDRDMSFLMQGLPRMTFSADGGQLATANERQVMLWDVRRCTSRRTLPSRDGGSAFSGLVTLPDGQVLASTDGGTLYKGDLFGSSGALQPVPKAPHRSDMLLGVSRDGKQVLTRGRNDSRGGPFVPSELRVVDLQTGAVEELAKYRGASTASDGFAAMQPGSAAISRSGRWVIESRQGFATIYDRQARAVAGRVQLAAPAAGTTDPTSNTAGPHAAPPEELQPRMAEGLKKLPPSAFRTELEEQMKSLSAAVAQAKRAARDGQAGPPGWIGFSDNEDRVYLWKNPGAGASSAAPNSPDQAPIIEVRSVPDLALVNRAAIRDPSAVNRGAAGVAVSFASARDGTALAVSLITGDMAGGRTGMVDLTQLPTQAVVRAWKPTGSGPGRLAWTPDGHLVAVHGGAVGGGATASLAGRATALGPISGVPNAQNLTVRWSLDSGEVATQSTVTTDILPFAISSGGRFAAMLKSSARGAKSASTGYRLEVVDTQTRLAAFESVLQGLEVSQVPAFEGLAVTPDGRRVAVLNGLPSSGPARQHLRLYDSATGRLLAQQTLPLRAAEYNLMQPKMRFTSEGKVLLVVGDRAAGELLRIEVSDVGFLKTNALKTGTGLVDVVGDGPLRLLVRGARSAGPAAAEGMDVIALPGDEDDLVALNAAGTKLAVAHEDGSVQVLDVVPGGLRGTAARLPGHVAKVVALAFSPDGRRLASSDEQGTTIVRDVASGTILASLFAFTDGSWAVVDPQGRFDTNQLEDLEYLHWVMPDDPLRALPLDIFMREYFSPGLLARVMRGNALPDVRPISALNRAQPVLRITGITPSRSDPRRVDVAVEAEGRTDLAGRPGGVADVRLFRDGRLVGYPQRAGELLKLDPKTQRVSTTFRDIRLPQGADSVVFSAYAFNADRVKGATVRSEFRVPPGSRSTQKGKAYLIAIGVNRYDNPAFNLRFAAQDARLVADALSARLASAQGHREVVPVTLVSDGERARDATKARVRAVLAVLAGQPADRAELAGIANAGRLEAATPDDLVIVTFAGHGHADERGVFYLLPQDIGNGSSRQATPQVLAQSISSDELEVWLRDIDAGETALVIDACQSAASVEGDGFKPGPLGSRGLGQLAYDKGMRILAASQADDEAREPVGLRHGLLTYALMRDGIEARRADFKPADKRILLAEWLGFGVQAVPRLQRELASGDRAPDGSGRPAVRAGSAVARIQQPRLFDFSRTGDGPALEVLR